jgi:hypothetical protein
MLCYSLPRDICHVNERVVERGVDVRHPEHELTIRHLFEKERESTESGTVSLRPPNSRSVLVARAKRNQRRTGRGCSARKNRARRSLLAARP